MADTDTNVTALHPKTKDVTGALRARRLRRKRKARSTVTTPVSNPQNADLKKPHDIKANVTVARRAAHVADVTAYVAAVGLASVAALFSIKGMVQLFPGTPLLIIAMATMMEASKLIAAGWLANRWRVTAWIWRVTLVALVVGLAVINATGVYAQLVSAHVGERGAATSAVETQDAALAARIDVQAHTVADLDRRLGQIDFAIEEAAKRGRTTTALTAMAAQRKSREALVEQRRAEASTLADLNAERSALGTKGRQIETEAAPIRYVAELVGADADSERAIRWLVLMMVLCCDPLAIALTAAASARRES